MSKGKMFVLIVAAVTAALVAINSSRDKPNPSAARTNDNPFNTPVAVPKMRHCEKVEAGEITGPFKAKADAAWAKADADCIRYFDILFSAEE